MSLESADKKESSEISGQRGHPSHQTPNIPAVLIPVDVNRKHSSDWAVCHSSEETLNFWKGIADVGLLGEVVTNISTELLELLNGVKQRSETAALQDTGTVQSWCVLDV